MFIHAIKKSIIVFILIVLPIAMFAQSKKIFIFCEVGYNGKVAYFNNLEKILPDSLRTTIIVDPQKEYNLRNFKDALLLMGANGWNPISIDYLHSTCTMTREVMLDETAWESYIDKLKTIGKAKQQPAPAHLRMN